MLKIAIPVANGKLCMHFGHCESFVLLDTEDKKILKSEEIEAPPHQPGLLPPWLAQKGVGLIIAGGMGQRAQNLFTEQNIKVIVGAPAESPELFVNKYFENNLQTGENACDH